MDVAASTEAITQAIRAQAPDVLQSVSVASYITELDALPEYASYSHVSARLRQLAEQIRERGGDRLCDDYHKLVLLALIARSQQSDLGTVLPESVRRLVDAEFERIVTETASNEAGFYRYTNDLFIRDLCLARGKLIPVGVGVVELSGVPRSIVVKGIAQFFKSLCFFSLIVRGFRPFYLLHTNPRALQHFNAQGWDRTYVLIAELLRVNPQIKGVFRSNWFIDPQLEHVSPRLTYLRRRLADNGAWSFLVGPSEDPEKNALAKSASRRKLFEEGKYVPTDYLQAWPRKALLRWAHNSQAAGNSAMAESAR